MGKIKDLVKKSDISNYLINGNLDFWQRNTTFTGVQVEGYRADRWVVGGAAGVTCEATVSRSTDVPNPESDYSMNVAVTTAQASFSTTQRYGIFQRIEGTFFKSIKSKVGFFTFWAKTSTAGTYSVSFFNDPTVVSYVTNFTMSAANTWEKKTIMVDFSNAPGSWSSGTGTGAYVYITLASGPTYTTSSVDQWNSALNFAGTSQLNLMNTVGNYFRIAQLKLSDRLDDQYTTFGNSYDSELKACQRYYEKSYNVNTPVGTAGSTQGQLVYANWSAISSYVPFTDFTYKTPKRANAVVVFYSPISGSTGRVSADSTDYLGAGSAGLGEAGFSWGYSGAQIPTIQIITTHYSADAEL